MAIELNGLGGGSQVYNAVYDVYRLKMTGAQAEALCTVGDLHRFIADRYRTTYQEGCISSSVFYAIRRALTFVGVKRQSIKRNAMLEFVIPREDRACVWATVQGELGCKLPRMRYNHAVENDIQMVGVAGFLLGAAGVSSLAICASWWSVAALSSGMFLYGVFAKLNSHDYIDCSLDLHFPSGYETFEHAVKTVVAWNFGDVAMMTGKWNDKELLASLRTIISSVADIKPAEISMTTKFADLPYYEDD